MIYENESLETWARKWNIPAQAINELRAGLTEHAQRAAHGGLSETDVAKRMLMSKSGLGWRLWRNNVGAGMLSDTHGQVSGYVRFGLANESAQMNRVIKSSDYVGIRPLLIVPEMVGVYVGQFVSIETKAPGWVFNPNSPHEKAQEKWLLLIRSLGGYAVFHTEEK